jgi:pyridoxamine 5'-phosphate oxidase
MAEFKDTANDAPRVAPGGDPLEVLNTWHAQALARGDTSPDAMTLATATRDGRPSARIVLFKGISRGGVFFVTNYQSRKASELEENPRAALVWHFAPAEQQVRVEGRVERASAAESEAYFHSRPRGSQLGAWASPQSRPIGSRAELEALAEGAEARFKDRDVARPEHWGGYLVFPETVELWLGRPDRLHDRFLYRKLGPSAGWSVERLAP